MDNVWYIYTVEYIGNRKENLELTQYTIPIKIMAKKRTRKYVEIHLYLFHSTRIHKQAKLINVS